MKPVIGIDHGDARIGVAASDALRLLAHPVETIPAQPPAAALKRLSEIFHQRGASEIILGLPVRQDGTEGPSAEKIRRFAATLATTLPPGTPIHFQDEYGTTKQAAAHLCAAGRKANTHRPVIDQAAATVILQEWLDNQSGRLLPEIEAPET